MTTHISEKDSLWYSGEFEAISKTFKERFFRMQEQLDALKTIFLAIGQDKSDREITRTICTQTSQLMRAERTSLFTVNYEDPAHPYLLTRIAQQSDPIRVEFKQGIAGHAAYLKKVINLKDAYKDKRFDPTYDQRSGFRTTSCICAPIFIRDELIGVIEVLNKLNGYFTLDDEETLTSLCSQLGVSLAQYRLYIKLVNSNAELTEAREALKQKNEELQMLYDIERDASHAHDLTAFLRRMSSRCLETFHANYAVTVLTDKSEFLFYEMNRQNEANGELTLRATSKRPSFLRPIMECSTSMMLDSSINGELEAQTKLEFNIALNAMIAIKLSKGGTDLGVFIMGRTRPDHTPFSTSAGHLFELVANSLASTIALFHEREEDDKQKRLTAIGEMMSSLMHDMKTPLANIQGYTELMAAPSVSQEKREDFAKTVERQVETLKNMSSEILQFSRGESTMLIRNNDVGKIIRGAVALLHPEADKRNITLHIDDHYKQPVPCDELKLHRLIINLVKNAIEAIDHDGHITLSTYDDETYLYLKIEDDGPGIPEEIRDKIFEPFVTRGKKCGTGLGLAIVKKIVDDHKAKITCLPASPHGTVFLIAIPKT